MGVLRGACLSRERGLKTHETDKQAKEKEPKRRLKAGSGAKTDEAHKDRLLRVQAYERYLAEERAGANAEASQELALAKMMRAVLAFAGKLRGK